LDPPYDIKLVFVQEITFFRKKNQQKLLPSELHFDSNMHQIVCRLGLRPRPTGGTYSVTGPYLYLGGIFLKGGEERGGEEERRSGEGVRPLT